MMDPGIDWLADMPDHWTGMRLKHVCTMRSGQGITEQQVEAAGQYPVYGGNGRRGYATSWTHEGPVALVGRQGALCGNVHLGVGKFWASEHAVVAPLRVVEHDVRWFTALLQTMNLNQYSVAAAQPGLAVERVLNLRVPVPPPVEQAAIAKFLGHVDRRIRRYIRAKQKLIKLLDEQKRAIVHRAVTRGLDEAVALKPSGIDWLGDMPAHWELKRAKAWLREVDERSQTGSEELLSVSHITGVTPRSAKSVTMFKPETYDGHKVCAQGDLVINTMWAWAGAMGVAQQPGIVSPSYAVYRPTAGLFMHSYLDELVRAPMYLNEYVRSSTGIRRSRLRLYPEAFLRLPLLKPPLDEQRRIMTWVSDATSALMGALRNQGEQVVLLEQLRSRLIADVVTGKLDVREVASRLPDESDDDEIDSEPVTGEDETESDDDLAEGVEG